MLFPLEEKVTMKFSPADGKERKKGSNNREKTKGRQDFGKVRGECCPVTRKGSLFSRGKKRKRGQRKKLKGPSLNATGPGEGKNHSRPARRKKEGKKNRFERRGNPGESQEQKQQLYEEEKKRREKRKRGLSSVSRKKKGFAGCGNRYNKRKKRGSSQKKEVTPQLLVQARAEETWLWKRALKGARRAKRKEAHTVFFHEKIRTTLPGKRVCLLVKRKGGGGGQRPKNADLLTNWGVSSKGKGREKRKNKRMNLFNKKGCRAQIKWAGRRPKLYIPSSTRPRLHYAAA